MAAVAHGSPAEIRRLALVPAGGGSRVRAPGTVYRRRQAVALLVAATVLAALVLAVGGLLASFGGGPLTTSERPGAPAAVYVVQPGDTFWDIARRLRPGEDPRPLVARLVAAHGSPVLVAGERLTLPVPA
jgi:hypothetical protein